MKNPLFVLLAAALLVLLIGCVNVANLLITARPFADEKSCSAKALGASRGRLIGQLLAESGLLALAGGVLGVLLRGAMTRALVLLVCSALVLKSRGRMLDVDPGFEVDHIVNTRVAPSDRYVDTTLVALYRNLTERIAGRGGVDAVAAANVAPLSPSGINRPIRLVGQPTGGTDRIMSAVTAVTAGYFRATDIRLLRGREFSWNDAKAALIVNQTAAKQFWPSDDPIGRRVAFGMRDTVGLEVVGIAADSRSRAITSDPVPVLYLSYSGATSVARSMTILVRGRGDVASLLAASKAALRDVDPMLHLFAVRPLRDVVDQSLAQSRLNSTILATFAAPALLLAGIGIYGVVSFSVAQRTQEIGVRMALGAQRRDVFRLVLREGTALAAVGVAVGIVAALGATTVIQSWLFGIERGDPATLVAMPVILVGIAVVATCIPAMRATRVDPLLAMRSE